MTRLAGRGAVVTGAGQGIGRAIAVKLAQEGARVMVLDMDADNAAGTVAALTGDGHLSRGCDVTDSAALADAVAAARKAFGRIALAVANAGIGRAEGDGSDEFYGAMAQKNAGEDVHVDQLIHMSDDGWRAVMKVNADGAFFLAREAVRAMAAGDHGGAIVFISSTSAQSGEGSPHYCASKAAVIGLARQLSRELAGRGIRVNCVAPGPTDTPIMQNVPSEWIDAMEAAVPLGRMARPEEIANAVAYLCSDEASFTTGSVLVANGGSYFF